MKANLAVKPNSSTPTIQKEYMAYFFHILNSVIFYRTAEKGKSTPIGSIRIKTQDLPMGFKLKPVHDLEELKELMQ